MIAVWAVQLGNTAAWEVDIFTDDVCSDSANTGIYAYDQNWDCISFDGLPPILSIHVWSEVNCFYFTAYGNDDCSGDEWTILDDQCLISSDYNAQFKSISVIQATAC